MNKTETVKNVTYSSGNRVATVERVVSRADDSESLGNFYFRLADVLRRLEICEVEAERVNLAAEKKKLEANIEEYTQYLAGYESVEA